MTYESPYGKQAGLRERIDDWMEKFAQNRSYPWVGTGLIDDLEAVARYMDGEREDEGIRVPINEFTRTYLGLDKNSKVKAEIDAGAAKLDQLMMDTAVKVAEQEGWDL